MKKKKIFRKEKYIKVMLNNIIEYEDYDFIQSLAIAIGPYGWVSECDGIEVNNGFIKNYTICDEWCEEVEDES